MRWTNRFRLLWAYLRRRHDLRALPVEYIVETTAKCNLYCPMCPRETHAQPKEDMPDEIFQRLVRETAATAEHMMLIGLGEPLLDSKIFDRISYCEKHNISTLLSTNGTLLTEEASRRLLATGLKHVTFSFDGSTKESFEFYRKGARFERVRDNFLRFARLKHERRSPVQVVVQMVRMERNAGEVGDFERFWRAQPGVDAVRVKEDETNLMRPDAGHDAAEWKHPCHYLWRGPLYVKHNGDVYPCCQSYMLDGAPVGRIGSASLLEIFNSPEMQRMRRLHAAGRAGEIDVCARCCTPIPSSLLVTGSLLFHGDIVRSLLPLVERLAYLRRLIAPSKRVERKSDLVQIGRK